MGRDDGLAGLAEFGVVGGGGDLQLGNRIEVGRDDRLAEHGIAIVGAVQLEGDAAPILAADGGTEDIVGLFAGGAGAGGLHAGDQEVEAAHVAAEDRQFLHGALRHGVGDVGLLGLEQRGLRP